MFTKRQTLFIYVAAILTASFVGATTWLQLSPPKAPLPRYRSLPDFSLIDQAGNPVTLNDLRGKVWLADFVYTTCPGPCPIISAHMGRLQAKVPPGTELVSFSTDPEHDTPQVLAAYAKRFHAQAHWAFLTGPKDQVYDLIQNGFMLPIAAPQGAQIVHSTRIMLVDKTGQVRAFYDGATSDPDPQIIADAQRLLQE
jgi:protein SCO1/2